MSVPGNIAIFRSCDPLSVEGFVSLQAKWTHHGFNNQEQMMRQLYLWHQQVDLCLTLYSLSQHCKHFVPLPLFRSKTRDTKVLIEDTDDDS